MKLLIKYCFIAMFKVAKFFKQVTMRMVRFLYTSYAKYKSTECGKNLRVNYRSSFDGIVYFGDNCNFNGMIVQGGGEVSFGNNFHSGFGCIIITSNHNFDAGTKIPYDETLIFKKITIEDNVWIGNNVIIIGNITIGEGAIIAAGSVVCNDVEPCSIVGGNPAKYIKMRDIGHYNMLKEQQKFF